MIKIKNFVFNAFQVNTYLIYDKTKECALIDAGCYEKAEQEELYSYIERHGLKPVLLLNTHCHIDHVLGNGFIYRSFNLNPHTHVDSRVFVKNMSEYAQTFGLKADKDVKYIYNLSEKESVGFGETIFKVLHTPGHADGSLCFFNEKHNFVFTGDVLFKQGIGRTDLPTGNLDVLLSMIKKKLFKLNDNVMVYPGHGEASTIGEEKKTNPFLLSN